MSKIYIFFSLIFFPVTSFIPKTGVLYTCYEVWAKQIWTFSKLVYKQQMNCSKFVNNLFLFAQFFGSTKYFINVRHYYIEHSPLQREKELYFVSHLL